MDFSFILILTLFLIFKIDLLHLGDVFNSDLDLDLDLDLDFNFELNFDLEEFDFVFDFLLLLIFSKWTTFKESL